MSALVQVRLKEPAKIELTLTITLPAEAWRQVRDRQYYGPFHDAIGEALAKIAEIQCEHGVELDVLAHRPHPTTTHSS